jgi:hypothetical protein
MPMPETVPYYLFEALQSQRDQALQMIAALTLTDDEVISCLGGEDKNLVGWAESMKEDLLAPGKYGRDSLIDMLTRHQFLTNSHAGFIYGAFEGPQITLDLVNEANLFISMTDEYSDGIGEEIENVGELYQYFKTKLRENNISEEHIEYIFQLMAVKIPEAALNRMRKQRIAKSLIS